MLPDSKGFERRAHESLSPFHRHQQVQFQFRLFAHKSDTYPRRFKLAFSSSYSSSAAPIAAVTCFNITNLCRTSIVGVGRHHTLDCSKDKGEVTNAGHTCALP